jgi:hypothetical protein
MRPASVAAAFFAIPGALEPQTAHLRPQRRTRAETREAA